MYYVVLFRDVMRHVQIELILYVVEKIQGMPSAPAKHRCYSAPFPPRVRIKSRCITVWSVSREM